MLTLSAARQRTATEYRKLSAGSGFALAEGIDTHAGIPIVEASERAALCRHMSPG